MSNLPWNEILSFKPFDIVKVLLTAVIILVVNKIQLFSDRLSALLIALPLTSLLAMIWMWHGGQSNSRIAGHAEGTFWAALSANCVLTTVFFWVTVVVLRKFGMDLMPK